MRSPAIGTCLNNGYLVNRVSGVSSGGERGVRSARRIRKFYETAPILFSNIQYHPLSLLSHSDNGFIPDSSRNSSIEYDRKISNTSNPGQVPLQLSLSLFLPQNFLSRVIPHSLFASSKEESSACPHVKCFSSSSVSSVLAPSLPLDSLSKISKSARHGRRDRGGLLLLLLLLIPFTRDKGRVVVDVGRGRIHCVRRYRDE